MIAASAIIIISLNYSENNMELLQEISENIPYKLNNLYS